MSPSRKLGVVWPSSGVDIFVEILLLSRLSKVLVLLPNIAGGFHLRGTDIDLE